MDPQLSLQLSFLIDVLLKDAIVIDCLSICFNVFLL